MITLEQLKELMEDSAFDHRCCWRHENGVPIDYWRNRYDDEPKRD